MKINKKTLQTTFFASKCNVFCNVATIFKSMRYRAFWANITKLQHETKLFLLFFLGPNFLKIFFKPKYFVIM